MPSLTSRPTVSRSISFRSLIATLGILTLLSGPTGCSSEHPNIGQVLGLRSSISDNAPLVANRAELTAYDPHHHAIEPANSPRLMQASARQPRR